MAISTIRWGIQPPTEVLMIHSKRVVNDKEEEDAAAEDAAADAEMVVDEEEEEEDAATDAEMVVKRKPLGPLQPRTNLAFGGISG